MIDFANTAIGYNLDSGYSAWLTGIRLLANLTIVLAIASVVCALYTLTDRHTAGLPAPRWLVVTFAAAVAICGVCHLARALGWGPPPDIRPGPVLMRVAFAAVWVIFAVQLPAVIERLGRPLSEVRLAPLNDQSMKDLAFLAECLETKPQSIDLFAINDSRPQPEMSRQIGEMLSELEKDKCKT